MVDRKQINTFECLLNIHLLVTVFSDQIFFRNTLLMQKLDYFMGEVTLLRNKMYWKKVKFLNSDPPIAWYIPET